MALEPINLSASLSGTTQEVSVGGTSELAKTCRDSKHMTRYSSGKRVFDIVTSLLCIVLFLPLFTILVAIIKITSPGPLFYKHGRLGLNGQIIHVRKFRSMKWEYCTGVGHNGDDMFQKLLDENPELKSEWEAYHKLKDDPRVSRIGRFLRRTSMDELPQFFNVLGGSLSMVGPRPIVKAEVEKYGDDAPLLFSVKPGLTGLWQVSGRNNVAYEERIQLDLQYIENHNCLIDLHIVLKTVGVLCGKAKHGAY